MTLKLAFNTTESPVLVDAAGYVIGGRGWGVVDTTDQLAKDADAAGLIVDADEDALAASDNDDALAAVASLHDRRARLEAAQAMSKSELVEALPPDQVEAMDVGGDGLPPKSELVDAVASGEPVPAPAPETTTNKSRPAAKQK